MPFDPNKYTSYKPQNGDTLDAIKRDLQADFPLAHILIVHQSDYIHFRNSDKIAQYHVEINNPILIFNWTYGYDIFVLREAAFKYDGETKSGEFLCDTATVEGGCFYTLKRMDGSADQLEHYWPEKYYGLENKTAIKMAEKDLVHDYPGHSIIICHGSIPSFQNSQKLIEKSLTLSTSYGWGVGGNWDCKVYLFQGSASVQLGVDNLENLYLCSGSFTRVSRHLAFRHRSASPINESEWMGRISDNDKLCLSQITIPGTHQSQALYGTFRLGANSWAACQSSGHDITWQLNAGIRFLDLRCRWDEGTKTLRMCHENFNTTGTLNDIVQSVLQFLREHPRETVITSIRSEVNTSTPTSNPFAQAVHGIIKANKAAWHLGTNIPLLADIRGKIVLFRRYEEANAPYLATTGPIGGLYAPDLPADIAVQDNYNPSRPDRDVAKAFDDKWNAITALFKISSTRNPSPLCLNYISGILLPFGENSNLAKVGSYIFGKTPYQFATKMNYRLHNYLDRYNDKMEKVNLGVVLMDYPDLWDNQEKWEPGLITKLIRLNFVDW